MIPHPDAETLARNTPRLPFNLLGPGARRQAARLKAKAAWAVKFYASADVAPPSRQLLRWQARHPLTAKDRLSGRR